MTNFGTNFAVIRYNVTNVINSWFLPRDLHLIHNLIRWRIIKFRCIIYFLFISAYVSQVYKFFSLFQFVIIHVYIHLRSFSCHNCYNCNRKIYFHVVTCQSLFPDFQIFLQSVTLNLHVFTMLSAKLIATDSILVDVSSIAFLSIFFNVLSHRNILEALFQIDEFWKR